MAKSLVSLLSLFLSSSVSLWAATIDGAVQLRDQKMTEPLTVNGVLELQSSTLTGLTVNGSANLKKTVVRDATSIDGALKASNVQLAETVINGGAEIQQTSVMGKLSIDGALVANKSDFQEMLVNGGLKIKESKVQAKAVVNGGIFAENTQFQEDLRVNAEEATFINTSLKNLTMKGAGKKEPKVLLRTKTQVEGDVVFEGVAGAVFIEDDAVIKGKIVNGKQMKRLARN